MYGPQISQMCQRTKPFCVIKDAMQQDRFFLLCLGISFSTILVLLQFHSSAITSFNSKTYYICAFDGAYNLIKFKNDPYFHSWMKWIIFLPFFENFCCVVCFYLPLLSIYFFYFYIEPTLCVFCLGLASKDVVFPITYIKKIGQQMSHDLPPWAGSWNPNSQNYVHGEACT